MYMSAISNLINGLQSLFSSSAEQPQQIYAINRNTLLNIFQLFNTELFQITEDIPADDEDIQEAAVEYAQIGSQIADHLTDRELTQITLKSQVSREDGASLLFLEYDHTAVENNTESWAKLMLSTLTFRDGEIQTIPQFTLSGVYKLCPSSGGLIFIPRDVTCLVHKDGEAQYEQPTEVAEFHGAIVYGSQAFTQLIAGLPINVTENQKWMDVESYHEAAKICETLRGRTATTFASDVKVAAQKLTFQ